MPTCRLSLAFFMAIGDGQTGDKDITTDAVEEQTTRATSNVSSESSAQTLMPTFLERSVHVFVPADAGQQGIGDQGGCVPRVGEVDWTWCGSRAAAAAAATLRACI